MFRFSIVFFLLGMFTHLGHSQPERQVTNVYKGPTAELVQINWGRNVVDTVRFPTYGDECTLELVTVGLNGWGRVSGMNAFGDLEKAQRLEFNGSDNFIVVGALVFFERPAIVGDGSVNCKIYSVNPSTGGPLAVRGFSNGVRVSEVYSDSVALATPFSFESGVEVNLSEPRFFASIDFSNLYGSEDTLVLLQTIPECGDGSNTWELHNDGVSWYPISSSFSWGINADFIISAIVDFNDPTAIDDNIATEDFVLHPAFPNPSSDEIRLNYSIGKSTLMRINVYDQAGRLLSDFDLGKLNEGRHFFEINTSKYPAGNYLYRLVSENGSITSRFKVAR